jgi:hypothetical protein
MTTDIANLYEKFSNYINVDTTDQKAINFLPRISHGIYNEILNIYLNQNVPTELSLGEFNLKEYINIIIDPDTLELQDIINFKTYDDSYAIINIFEKTCTFQIYSFDILKNIFEINKNKNIFIPIMLTKYKEKIGHACLLIINRDEKYIKFFDPNGITQVSSLDINSNIVDDIMEKYTLIFNSIDNTNYKYIKQSEWLQQNILTENIIMNDSTTNSVIGSKGSCVIITIIMAHMINLYDGYSIKDLILLFNKMSLEEKAFFIKNYTQCVYNLMKEYDV